jgi:cyclic beta-1,2-glucan synthetase
VWLAWFLCAALHNFARICDRRGADAAAEQLRARAAAYAVAAELHGWDGAWYRRAFFDDGTALGSSDSAECRIDSLAQSWAVLSGCARPDRARLALRAAHDQLVLADDRLVLLLAPPFDRAVPSPGYIRAYPPGIRENGGQYTHAAIWVAWAFAAAGDGDMAGRLLAMLNPVLRAATQAQCARYRVEPYVLAGDICGMDAQRGRGGWTWYTGSAAWLYRLAVEMVLGLRLERGQAVIDPCISRDWERYDIALRVGGSTYQIHVHNPDHVCRGVSAVEIDGAVNSSPTIPLLDDGSIHHVTVRLGDVRGSKRIEATGAAPRPMDRDQMLVATGEKE